MKEESGILDIDGKLSAREFTIILAECLRTTKSVDATSMAFGGDQSKAYLHFQADGRKFRITVERSHA